MALFRIFKGNSNKLGTAPTSGQQDTRYAHEGFAYFTPDDGKFYIDIAGNAGDTSTVAVSTYGASGRNRIPISAEKADRDNSGNIITQTYAADIGVDSTDNKIKLYNKTGSAIANAEIDGLEVSTLGFDDEPTPDSINLLSSGTIYTVLQNLGDGLPPQSNATNGQFLQSDGTDANWATITTTDELVKQTAKSDSVNYKLLATASASPTSGNAAEAIYDASITINPNTHTITASHFVGDLTGNASSASSVAWSNVTNKPDSYYTLPLAASGTRGGIQIGYSESGNNYAVKLSSEKAYVTVPLDTKAPLASPALTGTPTAPTAIAGTNTTQIATTEFVTNAITDLTGPMRFIGSLGTGGTATSLSAAAAANKGHTYKVITAGTYQSVAAKVGDLLISNGSSWVLIPSGDEPSGTVTSITLKAGNGIALDVDNTAITDSGTRTISHADTSSVSNVTAADRTYVKSLTFDTYGHVTAVSTGTETVTDTKNTAGSTDTSSKIYLIGATSQAANPQTYSDNEVYATSGVLTVKTLNSTSLTASQSVSTDANKNLISTNLSVSDSTTDDGLQYVYKVTQSAVGKITVSKSNIRSASTDQTGVTQYTATNTNTQLATLPTNWTATPTDDTYLIRRDTGGGASFGQVKFSTIWSYISGKITNGIYWANEKATSSATYNTTPEMATIKLNGDTSASAASTKNVVLQYDSTLEALNFVFT